MECISKDCVLDFNVIDQAEEPAFRQYKAGSEVRNTRLAPQGGLTAVNSSLTTDNVY